MMRVFFTLLTLRVFAQAPPTLQLLNPVSPHANCCVVRVSTASGSQLFETVAAVGDPVRLPELAQGRYLLTVEYTGAGVSRMLEIPLASTPLLVDLSLAVPVTVTAQRGAVVSAADSAAVTSIRELASFRERGPLPTTGQLLEGSGALLQQTGASQVSPFLRGLTGYQVLNLVDGIRLNNSTFRSGPNQYLAFVDPSQLQRVESFLGPASAEYGSDSLGGAIQLFTREARFDAGARRVRGDASLFGASSDLSAGGDGQVLVSSPRWMWLAGVHGRSHSPIRPGGGADSRHALYRYFGLNPDQIESITGSSRLVDTGFRQAGVHSKVSVRPGAGQVLTAWYQRSAQGGANNYKDLWGGLGRMASTLEPQGLDLSYLRYEKAGGLGAFLDSVSGTVSWNRQRDGSMRQGLRRTDRVTTDAVTVDAVGYTGQATAHIGPRDALVFGGEHYNESIAASRLDYDPVSGTRARVRPLYPDDSRYRNSGLFAQNRLELLAGRRLVLNGGIRWTRAGYRTRSDASVGVAESSQVFYDLTYNTSVLYQVRPGFGVHALIGRGFRAPNANDLGAVGLNDLGYEIPASAAVPAGAILGSSSGETATSLGRPVAGLAAERLYNYEFGVRLRTGRNTAARVQAFDSELQDPIVRRTLLFPADRVPATLAGVALRPIEPTAAQRAAGLVTVAPVGIDARALKAFVNDGRSRYYGIEAQWTSASLARIGSGTLSLEASYFYILGRDLNPNRNIRRLPPQQGNVRLRYSRTRYWFETSATAAGAQSRLSGGDIDDERIGASRSRSDVAAFFNGSRIAPFLTSGGVFGPTGETLAQIQDRVLPGVTALTARVPLYFATAGWWTWNLNAGYRIGEHVTWNAALLNLLDRNYRVHGSGIDGPGINAYTSLRFTF